MEIHTVEVSTVDEPATDDPTRQTHWWETEPMADPMAAYSEYEQTASWMGPGEDPFVVEIETSDGVRGFGVGIGGPYACAIIDSHYRRFLEGVDPFAIEKLWDQMYRAQLPYGQRGLAMLAISGVDLALWDLRGKLTGQPVYNLLGGQIKEEIPCYVTTHPSVMDHVSGMGFPGVKLSSPWGPADGYGRGLDRLEKDIAQARERFDETTDLMIDSYMAWDREFLVRAANRLKEYDLKWIEDPLEPDSVSEYQAIKAQVNPIQVAVGNLEVGQEAFHRILMADVADILQPEIRMVGGLTEMRRIAAMARPFGVPIYPHTASVYGYHFVAAHSNAPWAEYIVSGDGQEIRPFLPAVDGEPLPENGSVALSNEPGFGLSLDRSVLTPY